MAVMSIARRMSEPVTAPARRIVTHYVGFFEDLIHAVKSELVAKIDGISSRLDDLDRSVATSHQSISDQIAVQAATIRNLSAEVERLQALAARLEAAQVAVELDADRRAETTIDVAREAAAPVGA